MSELQNTLLSLSTAIRRKPGMYFGTQGSAAIPRMMRGLIDAVLASATAKYSGPISVSVTGRGRRQIISIEFGGLCSKIFSPARMDASLDTLLSSKGWEIGAVAGASDQFILESCDGKKRARLAIRDGFRVSTKVTASARKPSLRVTFQPLVSVFNYLSHEGLYSIAGNLRDLSLLRRGTPTRFHADALDGELRYFYQHGLESLLFEDDYARWPLHPGCLSFKASSKDMSVEGHLRFLHAGVPFVQNYVNFHPTQGGAHLEGLGAALRELFPDNSRGCRQAPFVTNPDTGARIEVPHTFIGAMHLRTANPKYYGPTKDVLLGDEVCEFVRLAASEPLRQQWQALRGR